MSHLWNLQRDMFHTEFGSDQLVFPTAINKPDEVDMASSGIVYTDAGFARVANKLPNISQYQWSACGLFIEPPRENPIPYRVKAYATSEAEEIYLVVGFAGPAIVAASTRIYQVIALPMRLRSMDEILLIKPQGPGDPGFDRALAFGVAVGQSQGAVTEFALSVQKMSEAPPKYASSTS